MRTANFMFYGEDHLDLANAFLNDLPIMVGTSIIRGQISLLSEQRSFKMVIVSRRETRDTRGAGEDAETVFIYDLVEAE